MKKTLALICVLAMLLTFCGCRETKVETSVLSFMDGDEIQAGTTVTDGDKDASTTQSGGKGEASKGSTGGVTSGGANNNAVATGSNSKIDNPLNVDLKGATVTVYEQSESNGIYFVADAKSSKTNAAKAEMLKKLQKELNCKIVVKRVDYSKLKTLVSTSAAGGRALSEIISTRIYGMSGYIAGNLVADMGKISSMDLSKDYMKGGGLLEATRFGKGRYAIMTNDGSQATAVFYNKRILKELGYKDDYLYNLVDSGKWTFDELHKLAKKAQKDTNGKPGQQSDDQWGMYIKDYESMISYDALASAGTSLISFENGKLKNNMTDPLVIKSLTKVHESIGKDGLRGPGNGATKVQNNFAQGNGLFFYTSLGYAGGFASIMKDEVGLLPAPKYSASVKDYVSTIDWNMTGLMIPAGLTAQKQYNAGAVIQAYMYLMQDVYEVTKKEYRNRWLCDDESVKNMEIIMEAQKVLPEQVYGQASGDIQNGTLWVMWNYLTSKHTPMAPAIESTKVACQKSLDDLNKKIKDK